MQAYTDVASVRGVGLSLIGLAATEAVEHQPEKVVQIAAAADVYAQQEGIVNVHTNEKPGREYVRSGASSALGVARTTEAGRRLTIKIQPSSHPFVTARGATSGAWPRCP